MFDQALGAIKDSVTQKLLQPRPGGVQYPSDWNIGEIPTGLLFSVMSQRNFSPSRDRTGVFGGSVGEEYSASFMLPPVNMEDGASYNYSQEPLSAIAEIAGGTDDVGGAAVSGIMRKLEDMAGGSMGGANQLQAARGEMQDRQSVSFYDGAEHRTRDFTWKFMPKSADDVKAIVEIQKLIKKWSAPSISGRTVKIPPTWAVQEVYMDSSLQLTRQTPLMKFGPANVTSYNFNMSEDGMWKLFHSGDPVKVIMTLSLTEVYINSKEDIEEYGL